MTILGSYPQVRLRRNRKSDWSRRLVSENRLSVEDLVLPVFVKNGNGDIEQINSMPGVYRYSIDKLTEVAKEAESFGIPALAVFPVVDAKSKSDDARESFNSDNLICRAISTLKEQDLNIGIITDVALDPYTTHGHDGIVVGKDVDNDMTVELLCKQAVAQAKAGCDIVAPSDMMDGRVGKIREALDSVGFKNVQIMSYAAKYASSFYGPFREAVGSAKNLGSSNKKAYQMDPANSDEAIREVGMDIEEGADMVMIKPGMPYLDILSRVRQTFNIPTFAYQVSGEYAMIKNAGEKGLFDYENAIIESLVGFKRAGASGIFTYAALEIAKKIKE